MPEAENAGAWIDRQQWREERMRYDVLAKLETASLSRAGIVLQVRDFDDGLGVWRQELFRVLEYLDRRGYIVYHGPGPQVSITVKGLDYIHRTARRRHSLRES